MCEYICMYVPHNAMYSVYNVTCVWCTCSAKDQQAPHKVLAAGSSSSGLSCETPTATASALTVTATQYMPQGWEDGFIQQPTSRGTGGAVTHTHTQRTATLTLTDTPT